MPCGFEHRAGRRSGPFRRGRLGLLGPRLGRQLRALRLDALERLGGALDRLVADLHQELDMARARAAARALHWRLRGEQLADRLELGTVARRTLGHDVVDLNLHEAPASNSPASTLVR